MSRSNYDDDFEMNWRGIMYRGSVTSATRGKRGQQFFRDLVAALDAMPEKRLIANELITHGEVCALGALGLQRNVDMAKINADEPDKVGAAFNIAEALAREVVFMNDEAAYHVETPEQRWTRMRQWAASQIKDAAP